MHKAVFLDRDGLINQKAAPHEYITAWESFRFLPGVPQAIAELNDAGYLVFIVTNQRGIARGLMTLEDVTHIHEKMCQELALHNAHVNGIYVCPHQTGECNCRKPEIGLFLQAERAYKIDKTVSWMVGDSQTDVEAGMRYGVQTILTENLPQAVAVILKR